ncbi:MAG: N-acetylmuramoyl-L-alanine amidase [Puniceicoccales bacterium]|nr:N-acetylmuramoyl-L-alanine amidase [Puniceicoccales bacterium]
MLLLVACGFSHSPCCAVVGGERVTLTLIAQKYHLKTPINQPDKVTLRGNHMELSFKSQSRMFHANGVLMSLGFSTEVKDGKLCVAHSDYIAHICPFFSAKQRQNAAQKTIIVLDPGHGGRADGAISATGLKEKVATLDICQKAAQLLAKQGYVVYLTRDSDAHIELDDRTKFANQKFAKVFVSVHCNAAESKLAHGIETFALTPYGQPSQRKAKSPQAELKRYYSNKFDGENLMLAYNVQKALLRKTRSADRGVRHARFHVLKNLNCPGILVECGFLSNAVEGKKFASSCYRQTLAQAIADGITAFLR